MFSDRVEVSTPARSAVLPLSDFRAAGSNPAWTIEVDSGVAVEFATGQAGKRVVTTFPPASFTPKEKGPALATKSGSRVLTVVSESGVCEHAGSTMTLTVAVTLDGKTYSGCGRNLEPVGKPR